MSVAVPDAVTLKFAGCPAMIVWLAGWPVMVGATGAAVTVSIAALLVAVCDPSFTTTVNCCPLSELVVTGVVYEAEVAPLTAVPFFFH